MARDFNPWDNDPNKAPKNTGRKPQKGQGENKGQKPSPELDGIFTELKEMFANKKSSSSSGSGSSGSSGGNSGGGFLGKTYGLIMLAFVFLWLALGSFFVVDTQEQAIVLRFGKFNRIAEPGLNFKIPSPVETLVKVDVTSEKTESNFARSSLNRRYGTRSHPTYMLTGDENIVDLRYLVSWNIKDLEAYYFNVEDSGAYVKSAAESAVRDVINRRKINEVLTGNKGEIIDEVEDLLQEILDSYGAGIEVLRVDIQEPQVPESVKAAYDDVNDAKIERDTAIEQANRYRNKIIREVNGQIAKIVNDAEAYRESVIADAKGKASRFNAVEQEYRKAKRVTKDRIYLETMEEVLEGMDKVILDNKTGVLPYLPLSEIQKQGSK